MKREDEKQLKDEILSGLRSRCGHSLLSGISGCSVKRRQETTRSSARHLRQLKVAGVKRLEMQLLINETTRGRRGWTSEGTGEFRSRRSSHAHPCPTGHSEAACQQSQWGKEGWGSVIMCAATLVRNNSNLSLNLCSGWQLQINTLFISTQTKKEASSYCQLCHNLLQPFFRWLKSNKCC